MNKTVITGLIIMAFIVVAGGVLLAQPPPPAAGQQPGGGGGGMGGMRMGGMTPAIAVTNDFVFVVNGMMLYKFSIENLELLASCELPRPMGQFGARGGRAGGDQ
jgi:hypothetical protein